MPKLKIIHSFPVSPETIYKAWLSSKQHSAFTKSTAKTSSKVGGKFSSWDGYCFGRNLELNPFTKIVQSWRSTDFPDEAEDSTLQIDLIPFSKGTKLSLQHFDVPKGMANDLKKGWMDFYIIPMEKYFGKP